MVPLLLLVFGLASGCLLSILVGMFGSSRRIGFGWSFLISLIFTPLIGLIVVLVSDPLPGGGQKWGCIGGFLAFFGFACLLIFLLLLFAGGLLIAA